MLVFLLVILAVGAFCPAIIYFANRLGRAKFMARLKRENLDRIKSDLDEVSHAFNNGMLNEEEFEKKCNLLIDELLEQLFKTTNEENEQV
ncbi:hypothetical protein J2Y45_006675 [Dyadobacter sp. BE34]|uniref:Gas vesicle protein G n=1 Tax=Dyadobacter fermentans TaxID=94254 RepID=A0ABU1R8S7_9BACT|nr:MULTISPECIES: hypothetical protein [Dyadobacter]MDR6809597.1 hypothetical protein [Dyadobacter fermentans]MDR7047275.1 hypothetical protein [Dyadobacter sp. BE242]MDR7201511.1 hypothetical protein [Dyadobacter sp. BE34]MDR7219381.1 hypothetical protein [Dyadobacter sp. BE31]MDR7267225.1 hypothetical protein [Dyadobacter sp. BE32]